MNFFGRLLLHDLRMQMRNRSEWALLVLFFSIVIILLPFAIGPEPDLLRRLACGLVWLAAVLMSLLSVERLFVQDARDGTLDLMRLSPVPLPVLVFARLLAQTAAMLAALLVVLFPAALLLGMEARLLPAIAASLVLGVPSLVMLGGMMGAVTVALNKSPALLTLLLVPFYIPVLIFAVGVCDAAALGAPIAPNMLLLGAILAVVAPTAPFVVSAALKQN